MGFFRRKDESLFSYIEGQNAIIGENAAEIRKQEDYLKQLQSTIERVKIEHPGVEENIALWRSSNDLRGYIQQAEIQLDTKEKQLDMIEQAKEEELETALVDKRLELAKLEQQIIEEKKKREQEKFYNISDLFICSYTVSNINDLAIGVFMQQSDNSYSDVCILTSIDKSRIMRVSNAFSRNIEFKYSNAYLKQCISFAEACLAIGRVDLLTKTKVSVQEIYQVLYEMQGGFYFLGRTDITVEELLELMKQRSQEVSEIGGRQLTKMLISKNKDNN